jgi:hypothetical protein
MYDVFCPVYPVYQIDRFLAKNDTSIETYKINPLYEKKVNDAYGNCHMN